MQRSGEVLLALPARVLAWVPACAGMTVRVGDVVTD
jgi:hypothetical protein